MSVVVGITAALALLLVGSWLIRFVRDFRARRSFAVWQRLMWLPQPAYYWLLDRFTDNNGWRPLSYRERNRQSP